MRVAAIQMTPEFGQIERNRERAAALIECAESDLAVLPEMAFTGYCFASRAEAAEAAETAEGSSVRRMTELSKRLNTIICFGFPERSSGLIYNSAALVGPAGLIAVYRKIHLFNDEKDLFAPGPTPFFAVRAGAATVGMMICFDWFFPEAARSLALAGAQIILHPANLILAYCQEAMVTRCLENRVFAVTANRGGQEQPHGKTITFTGQSQITRPDGSYERLPDRKDGILVADIDTQRADDKSVTDKNHVWRDRRPELYFQREKE